MIAVKYGLFAAFSVVVNLFFQYLSFSIYDGVADLFIAMCAGTGSGLIAKYILDKKYIFYHQPKTKTQDAKTFMFYIITGGGTTFIFWGTEMGFDILFNIKSAKYIGAIIGLSIGYTIKYFLDKKYVFKKNESIS